jgi:hypothetical protein
MSATTILGSKAFTALKTAFGTKQRSHIIKAALALMGWAVLIALDIIGEDKPVITATSTTTSDDDTVVKG